VQLVAENLILSRGGRTVVDGLSFRIASGEALLLTGPNGSGKTTLLRALAGFLAPASGAIRVEDAPAERERAELAHFVGHLDGLKSHLTVAENLSFWAAYLDEDGGGATVERLEAALDRFDLAALADIPAGYLSAGQKRRLALARLGVAERPIWLLDEPTVSLDTASVTMLVKAIAGHVAGGGLAAIATHVPLALERAREIRLGRAVAAEPAQ
jgi:heme exporter protein A